MSAIAKLAHWLHEAKSVNFYWKTAALGIIDHSIKTSRGDFFADCIIICPGDDFSSLYPEHIAPHALSICTLQMVRVAANSANGKFHAALERFPKTASHFSKKRSNKSPF